MREHKARLTVGLQDPQNLVAGNALDLGNTLGVTENDADLGRRKTSSGELEDLVADLLRGGLGPRGLRASVGESGGRHALALGVHTGRHEHAGISVGVRCTYRPIFA